MWKKIITTAQNIGFTKNETTVILFLTTATLIGGAIRLFSGNEILQQKDYTETYRIHDSVFFARSNAPIIEEMPDSAIQSNPSGKTVSVTKKEAVLGTRKININRASEEELTKLPGVGPSTAKKIIEYRKTVGRFSKIEDIMNVKSIGEKKFEKMKPYICTGD